MSPLQQASIKYLPQIISCSHWGLPVPLGRLFSVSACTGNPKWARWLWLLREISPDMDLISHLTVNANSTGSYTELTQHITLCAFPTWLSGAKIRVWEVFFMCEHTCMYFQSIFSTIWICFFPQFLISSLAPLIRHSRYLDPPLMRWRSGWRNKWMEKWSGLDWRRRERAGHQLWKRNKSMAEMYTTGVIAFTPVCNVQRESQLFHRKKPLHAGDQRFFVCYRSLRWLLFPIVCCQ